jgi:RNA polymerase sigma factor (sigma-70 family)|tara:strand:+ start:1323 stop:1982 length:660 start_codon:yes stop_codon:yes gene_type:complete
MGRTLFSDKWHQFSQFLEQSLNNEGMKITPELSQMDQLSLDHKHWQGIREGDARALETVYRSHYSLLYDYGIKLGFHRELVKDEIQELFGYIWEKRASLSAAESVKSYLLASLRRRLLLAVKKERKQHAVHEEYHLERAREEFSPEDLILIAEQKASQRSRLSGAFRKIPERKREALYLKTNDGLMYKEISLVMDISPQVARNYVSEALKRLRELVTEE